MTPTVETTIRSIVVDDIRAAAVFDEFGIDYCCQGHRTIGEECRDRGLSASGVIAALIDVAGAPGERPPRFDAWEPHALASYIVSEHHEYARATLPSLIELTRSVAALHGDRHPEFHEIAVLVGSLAHDLQAHMLKEERILFPYIAELAAGHSGEGPFGSVENPIRMMEREHEAADRALARIRVLVRDYAPPPDASTIHRVCLDALREFERDLRRHVHLENNILFPKTRLLEAAHRA